jgi:hypothetical protein
MLLTSEMFLAYARSGLLLATTVSLATRRTQRLPSSFLPIIATNYDWVAISLFGCSVISDFFHTWILDGGDLFGWVRHIVQQCFHRILIICTATILHYDSFMDGTSTMVFRMANTMVHWFRAGVAKTVLHHEYRSIQHL